MPGFHQGFSRHAPFQFTQQPIFIFIASHKQISTLFLSSARIAHTAQKGTAPRPFRNMFHLHNLHCRIGRLSHFRQGVLQPFQLPLYFHGSPHKAGNIPRRPCQQADIQHEQPVLSIQKEHECIPQRTPAGSHRQPNAKCRGNSTHNRGS